MSESTIQLVLLEYNMRGKSDKAKDRWNQMMMDLIFYDQDLEFFPAGDGKLWKILV